MYPRFELHLILYFHCQKVTFKSHNLPLPTSLKKNKKKANLHNAETFDW